MRTANKLGFISFAAAALLFSGCGSGGSSNNSTPAVEVPTPTVITVERGPLLDANVTDAQGHVAVEIGAGEYAFDHNPEYPVTAKGGVIDVNRNGKIDAGEVKNELELTAQSGDVVTMATTLASDGNKTKVLEEQFGLTKEQIETQTPSQSKEIEAFSNTLYEYSVEKGYANPSDIPSAELETLVDEYKAKREAYQTDGQTPAEREQVVMDGLSLVTLDDADALQAQEELGTKLEENRKEHEELFNHSSSSMGQEAGSHLSEAGEHSSEMSEETGSHSSEAGEHSSEMSEETGSHSSEAGEHSSEISEETGSHTSSIGAEMGDFGSHPSEAETHSSEGQAHSSEMSGETGSHTSSIGAEMGDFGSHSSEAETHSSEAHSSSEMGGDFGSHSSENDTDNEDNEDNEGHSSSAGTVFNQNSTMRTTQSISI